MKAKRMVSEGTHAIGFICQVLNSDISVVDGAAPLPAPKRPAVQMPDEYLPPNKILFLQNLPASVTKDQLMSLFNQYAFHSLLVIEKL